MVNHICEPISPNQLASCRSARALQGGGEAPLTIQQRPGQSRAPNGYLNVRQGPGMNFKPIAKLVSGQRILVDMQTDEWTHLMRICDEKEDLDGWVYSKYVKDIDGSNINTLLPPQTEISPKTAI